MFNVTSMERDWPGVFSPFRMGPVPLWGGNVAQNVENAWQFSKVYSEHVGPNGRPTPAWLTWARRGWADRQAHRYPMGKGACPVGSFWAGEMLGYVDARMQIYVPLYAAAARRLAYWQLLEEAYRERDPLYLWDFDAYDLTTAGHASYVDALADPARRFGHGFVLALMLEEPNHPALHRATESAVEADDATPLFPV